MRICREGWPFVVGFLALAGGLFLFARSLRSTTLIFLSGVCLLLAGFCAYFFRDPDRSIPEGRSLILSPADGRIMEIVETTDGSTPVQIVRIFLSVFDPHLQRSPVNGRVRAIRYTRGRFLDARNPKAAFENEQNRIEIVPDNPSAAPLVVTQFAGLIARRIVCWVKEGQTVKAGAYLGLIRFGSQVDVIVPRAAKIRVKPGDRVTAGDAILAEVS